MNNQRCKRLLVFIETYVQNTDFVNKFSFESELRLNCILHQLIRLIMIIPYYVISLTKFSLDSYL